MPEGIPHTKKWVIGYVRADGEIVALANLVSDIFALSVWNVSTFLVETARHGSGDARCLYDSSKLGRGRRARAGCDWVS